MIKYPSTPQFRNIIQDIRTRHDYVGKDDDGKPIYKHTTPYPILEFEGTVKLHGTNAAVVKYFDGNIEYQSRERILSLEYDNSNFMLTMSSKNLDGLFDKLTWTESCAIYGEWCGRGIQKGVAINELEKMFVIFAVKVDGIFTELPPDLHDNEQGIWNIKQFKTYNILVDFNNPQLSQNKIIELTNEVEKECPVGKHFGVSGVGEGIVFRCKHYPDIIFKSKGEKHSSSKVKTLSAIDVDRLNTINEFVTYAVTENRLEQGIQYLKENLHEISVKSTGLFVKWVVNDVLKEEMDTLTENGLVPKDVGSPINKVAKVWFHQYLDKLVIG